MVPDDIQSAGTAGLVRLRFLPGLAELVVAPPRGVGEGLALDFHMTVRRLFMTARGLCFH